MLNQQLAPAGFRQAGRLGAVDEVEQRVDEARGRFAVGIVADAVSFSLVMLATTPAGDAYTFAEYKGMLERAGFHGATLYELPPTPVRAVIAQA